jgi:hypothetical protein
MLGVLRGMSTSRVFIVRHEREGIWLSALFQHLFLSLWRSLVLELVLELVQDDERSRSWRLLGLTYSTPKGSKVEIVCPTTHGLSWSFRTNKAPKRPQNRVGGSIQQK